MSKPLTDERLAEIRHMLDHPPVITAESIADELLAEVDRSRAETTEAWAEVQRLEAEVDRLRAENKQLGAEVTRLFYESRPTLAEVDGQDETEAGRLLAAITTHLAPMRCTDPPNTASGVHCAECCYGTGWADVHSEAELEVAKALEHARHLLAVASIPQTQRSRRGDR